MHKPTDSLVDALFSESPQIPPFVITVLFDSDEALRQGESTAAFIESKVSEDSVVENFHYNLRLLSGRTLDQAIEHSAESDMIVLALEHATAPTAALEKWAKSVAAERTGKTGALVALLPQVRLEEDSPEIFGFLQHFAGRAGMDFICRTDGRNRTNYYSML